MNAMDLLALYLRRPRRLMVLLPNPLPVPGMLWAAFQPNAMQLYLGQSLVLMAAVRPLG